MPQSKVFLEEGNKNMMCRLKKIFYDLKQVPRQWYMKFEGLMEMKGFKKWNVKHCCFFKKYKSSCIILFYINDMPVADSSMNEIRKDLGLAKRILSM